MPGVFCFCGVGFVRNLEGGKEGRREGRKVCVCVYGGAYVSRK